MIRYRYRYETDIRYEHPVEAHVVRLRCEPMECSYQSIVEECMELPEGFWAARAVDALGNRTVQAGMQESHDTFRYVCSGIVEHESAYVVTDPIPSGIYRLPSKLTMLPKEARGLLPIKLSSDFLTRCLEIAHATYKWMSYEPGSTNVQTTAADAYRERKGVCQDYAHLMIALCRGEGIAARYVCGLMEGEGATHAWVECHDGYSWYAFDPTNDTAIATGYIKIAHGRDASDCAVSRGAFRGITNQTTRINVKVTRI